MANQDRHRIFNVKGQLAFGVTDMSQPFPHGGTAIGYTSACVFDTNVVYDLPKAMEYGEHALEVIETEGTSVFSAVLRQWDNDALALLWPASSASNGERILANSTTYQRIRASTGVTLAFTPNDPRKPGIIMYRAVACLVDNRLSFNLSDELNCGMTFYCMLSDSGKSYEIAPVSELSNP